MSTALQRDGRVSQLTRQAQLADVFHSPRGHTRDRKGPGSNCIVRVTVAVTSSRRVR
jgi:hypothetical protein